jgi:hypothetical protein
LVPPEEEGRKREKRERERREEDREKNYFLNPKIFFHPTAKKEEKRTPLIGPILTQQMQSSLPTSPPLHQTIPPRLPHQTQAIFLQPLRHNIARQMQRGPTINLPRFWRKVLEEEGEVVGVFDGEVEGGGPVGSLVGLEGFFDSFGGECFDVCFDDLEEGEGEERGGEMRRKGGGREREREREEGSVGSAHIAW